MDSFVPACMHRLFVFIQIYLKNLKSKQLPLEQQCQELLASKLDYAPICSYVKELLMVSILNNNKYTPFNTYKWYTV